METINYAAGKLDFDGVDPELGMHLLQLHWNRQHHSFLITYRPAFMRDMACDGPYFSKLLLNAIYFGSSKFSNRIEVKKEPDDARSSGWRFRQRTKELLVEALEHSEIPTIQALLVMTSSLFALGDERSSAWVYAGIALRMIVVLGLHVDAALLTHHRRLSDEDLEIRRRVFWGAFVVDKIQSLYQGRPASIQETDTRVPITFLDRYEELEQWAPFAFRETQSYASSPAYSVTTFVELCKLCLIMNRIMNKVYTENSATTDPDKAVEDLNALHSELTAWRNGLPIHLAWSPGSKAACPPPHVLSLL